ncbi:MAG: NAD-binding protein [Promethearchaeota archaeon]
MPDKLVIIAGGGKFGYQAAKFFVKKQFKIVFIDPDEKCLVLSKLDINIIKIDDLDDALLNESGHLLIKDKAENVIPTIANKDLGILFFAPAIPANVMALISKNIIENRARQVTLNFNREQEFITCIQAKDDYDVHAFPENAIIILSYAKAGQKCPSNCPGALDFCPHRGKVQREPLFMNIRNCLSEIKNLDLFAVFESKQLAPGIGAIQWDDIIYFLNKLNNLLNTLNKKKNIVIGTACNCHGVINGFSIV